MIETMRTIDLPEPARDAWRQLLAFVANEEGDEHDLAAHFAVLKKAVLVSGDLAECLTVDGKRYYMDDVAPYLPKADR